MGLLKPPQPSEQTQGQHTFVPMFPFLYEKMECGDIIMDREGCVSLHVQPQGRQRVK